MRLALCAPLLAVLAMLLLPAAVWAEALVRPDAPVHAYAFNVGSGDVTVIDTATNEVVETRPLGASVRWLSNEQDFWDGRHIWTYDIVDGQVHLIAIDPATMQVVRRKEIGKGPAHSVQLTLDRGHVLVNAAGDNLLAVVEHRTLEIVRRVQTGLFPCDIDLSPDGTVAYFPERDQHTVAALDLATGEITKRVAFMEGSKPHMLRVSPDGATVWVQTAAAGSNAVLDAESLSVRTHGKLGQVPVTNAWSPDGRYSFVTHFADDFISVIDSRYRKEVKRIRVGQKVANVAFRPDGRYAYATVTGEDKVAVIDMERLEVVKDLPAGEEPWGLVVMSPPAE